MESAGILAGPMTRQVDTVSVALQMDRPVELDVSIYQLDTLLPLKTATNTTSVRAGHRLFTPPVWVCGQFPTERFLGYDLFFRIGTITFDLENSKMIHKNEDDTTCIVDCPTQLSPSPLLQLQTFASY